MMKKLFLFLLVCSAVQANQAAKYLFGESPELREYLQALESGLNGEAQWYSVPTEQLSTASYVTTATIAIPVRLIDDQGKKMYWFNESVSGFSVSDTGASGTATLGSSTLLLDGGVAGMVVILSGTWSVGDSVTVSFPAISRGVLNSVTASAVLTFTE